MVIGSHIIILMNSSTEVTRVNGCLVFMSLELPMTRVPPWRSSHASGFEAASPVVVSAQPARLGHVLDAAREQSADLLLIDTPPRAEQAAMAAVKASELILVPCRPAIYDLETVATTVELIRFAGDKPVVVVLNGVPPRGPKRDQATEILKSMGLLVCPTAFGYRAAFDHAGALGLNAQEYDPRGKAAGEIKLVYKFMSKLINSLTKQGARADGKANRRLTASHA